MVKDRVLAYLALVVCGLVIKVGSVGRLKALLLRVRATGARPSGHESARAICVLVDGVAAYSPWRARCLQRSAAMVLLLRRRGHAAQVVIGCRRVPFASHAWVESDGEIVSDDPRIAKFFSVIARF